MTSEIVNWFRDHSIQLKSIQPEDNLLNLTPLKEIMAKAQVIGLGEATHGNKEFFQIKDHLTRFLIEKMGFNTVIMESPEKGAQTIDHFIRTGNRPHSDLLSELGYEVWVTQEMLDFILWLRNFQQSNSSRILHFYGCDVNDQTGISAQERESQMAKNILKTIKPETKAVLWAHNAHVGNAKGEGYQMLGSFLKDSLGDKFMNFGLLCNQGTFNVHLTDSVSGKPLPVSTPYPISPATSDFYEYFFAQTKLPITITDLRPARTNSLFKPWQRNPLMIREFGWVLDPSHTEYRQRKTHLIDEFDGIIWIDNVTPSRLI